MREKYMKKGWGWPISTDVRQGRICLNNGGKSYRTKWNTSCTGDLQELMVLNT